MRDDRERGPSPGDLWKLLLAVIGAIAIIQELRKPAEERTWHGKVADLVPYDFRAPSLDRVKSTYWNPAGPLLSGKIFGVGWAPNLGALARLVGLRVSGPDSAPEQGDDG